MHKRTVFTFLTVAGLAIATAIASYAQNNQGAEKVEATPKNISYAIGYQIGQSYDQFDLKLKPKALAAGLRDQQSGDARLSEGQVKQVLQALSQKLKKQQAKANEKRGKQNRKAGQQFLANNKQKPGVKETQSGLQYKVLESGQGSSPGPNDRVTVHYTGKLLDGTVFDSSRKRGQPATFRVNRVIEGWSEALQKMKPGAQWKLWIPADLAYGNRGKGEIEPGDTLMFKVKLLEVKRQGSN